MQNINNNETYEDCMTRQEPIDDDDLYGNYPDQKGDFDYDNPLDDDFRNMLEDYHMAG